MSAVMPERPTLAGDWGDDDGQVFSDLLEPQADPLPPPAQVMVDPVSERPARVGRLLSGTLTIDPSWSPTMALPADPLRKTLIIQNSSATATDGVLVADDPGKLQTAQAGGRVLPLNPLTLHGYTGPVWLSALGAAAGVPVSWWAVTA